MINNPITQLEQLTLTGASKSFLKETVKWARFLSFVGFILIAFMLVFAAFSSTIFNMAAKVQPGIPKGIGLSVAIIYLILSIIYFFPVFYLLQFSSKMKKALATKNDETLAGAFKMLKSHYKFIGVFTIITLSLYALLFIVSLMGVI